MKSPIFATEHAVATICPLDCPDACSLEVVVQDGRIASIDGTHINPITDGYICAKVRRFPERVYGPDRLTYPAIRKGPKGLGSFERVPWEEALAKISDQQPQIIFVDIMMPRLDGYQTCALIKNNQMFKGTPVIMLSSKDGLFDKARGRIVGSDQYLTKPFTRDELLTAIRQYVPGG